MHMWNDMCQLDRTLYRKPLVTKYKICWTRAIDKAAKAMGYSYFMDVPDSQVEEMKMLARQIRIESGVLEGQKCWPDY